MILTRKVLRNSSFGDVDENLNLRRFTVGQLVLMYLEVMNTLKVWNDSYLGIIFKLIIEKSDN